MTVKLQTATPDLSTRPPEALALRAKREQLGLSYREMAEKLGVHRNTYLGWEIRGGAPLMARIAVDALIDAASTSRKK